MYFHNVSGSLMDEAKKILQYKDWRVQEILASEFILLN